MEQFRIVHIQKKKRKDISSFILQHKARIMDREMCIEQCNSNERNGVAWSRLGL